MDDQSRQADEIISQLKQQMRHRFGSWAPIVAVIGIIFLLFALKSTFYTIQPNEVGVVLRFGKFIKKTPPGLHFKFPLGIDTVYPVKVEYIFKEEFGFRTRSAAVRTTYSSQSYDDESLMLTGDLNILDLEWIVQFKIQDPFLALFNVRNLKVLRDISESIMRKIVGDYTFNEVLTTKRIEINDRVQQETQKVLDEYQIGVQIITVKLQDVNPPDPVKPAFNEVNEAKQEREKLINQAWEQYNQKIPQAKGEALKIVKQAEGYAVEKVNNAEGEAQRFTLLREEYDKAKDITHKRLYLENMKEVLKRAGRKYIIDPEEKGVLPLLKLEQDE